MDFQKVGQELLNELSKELQQKKTETNHIEGAIQGITLYFNKLVETLQSDEEAPVDESNQAASEKKASKKVNAK